VCPNVLPVILGVVIVVGLSAIMLTRLWVTQLGLRLEEGLRLDHRLVPIRNALVVLRDAVSLAHQVSKELETLKQLREEISTVLTDIRSFRDDFAETYNVRISDIEVHQETLVTLASTLEEAHRKLDEAFLRRLMWNLVCTLEARKTGEGLISFLESHNFRVNNRLRGLIVQFYDDGPDSLLRGYRHDGGEAEYETSAGPLEN